MITPQHMNVVFPVGTLEHTRNQVVINGHALLADRASPRYIVFKAAKTALNIHQAVYAAAGRESE